MIDQSHDFLGTLFGFIADVAIAIIIAEFTDIPFITIVLFMLFIQIFFAIRDTIWEWIAYFVGLRRAQQQTLVNLMRNKKFPEPNLADMDRFLFNTTYNENLPADTRIGAAALAGEIGMVRNLHPYTLALPLTWSLENAIKEYKRDFG